MGVGSHITTNPKSKSPSKHQCVQHARRAWKESIGRMLEEGLLCARQPAKLPPQQVHFLPSLWVPVISPRKR